MRNENISHCYFFSQKKNTFMMWFSSGKKTICKIQDLFIRNSVVRPIKCEKQVAKRRK